MIEIKNTIIFGLDRAIIRSGYPMTVKEINFSDTENDNKHFKRATHLAKALNGSGHDNFLKGIIVQFDLRYPEYFSPQLQRYHWIDIISSQSKMHKIMNKTLTNKDFVDDIPKDYLEHLNDLIEHGTIDAVLNALPSGYMKWMGISTNYLQLKTIYSQRKTHRLTEWRQFCEWISSLKLSTLITSNND